MGENITEQSPNYIIQDIQTIIEIFSNNNALGMLTNVRFDKFYLCDFNS